MAEALKPWYAVATPHEDIREGAACGGGFCCQSLGGRTEHRA